MNKFEKLIDYILNEDEAKAQALFHEIVVDKSREIYEGLIDDETGPVHDGESSEFEDEIGRHNDDIDGDESGIEGAEEDGDVDALGGEETDLDDIEGGEEDLEDRIMNLEDALDELKAEFDSMLSDEDEVGSEEGDEGFGDDEGEELGDDGEDVADEDGVEEEGTGEDSPSIYGESRKSPADMMREYVEKVGRDWGKNNPVEGDEVGNGAKVAVNTKSTQIAGKNDMGGTTANIARGGDEGPIPTSPKKPSNAYTKGEKKMGQDKYENSPAANTKGYATKRTAKTKQGAEVAATGSVSVNDTSIVK